MKKFLLVAFVSLMASTNAKAKSHLYETTDEVSIAYGAGSWLQIIDDILTVFTLPSHDEYESKRFIGPLSVEYFHHVNKVVSLGAVLSYSHSHRKVVSSSNPSPTVKMDIYYLTLLPAVKFDWKRAESYGLYSKLAAGMSLAMGKFDSDKANGTAFNFQVSLIGAEFGGTQWRGFGELGFGEQGIICAGIRHKF